MQRPAADRYHADSIIDPAVLDLPDPNEKTSHLASLTERSWLQNAGLQGGRGFSDPACAAERLASSLPGLLNSQQGAQTSLRDPAFHEDILPDDFWLPAYTQSGLLTEHSTEDPDAFLPDSQDDASSLAQQTPHDASSGNRRSLRLRKPHKCAGLSEEDEVQEPTEQGKRKVGRPISYIGDPNAEHLTEAERRRIKRRIANRESARRVRQKKQQTVSELSLQLEAAQEREQELHQALARETGRSQALSVKLQAVQERMHDLVASLQACRAEAQPVLYASNLPPCSSRLPSGLEPAALLDDVGMLPPNIMVPDQHSAPGWQIM